MSWLAENVGRIISAHPHGPKIKWEPRAVNWINKALTYVLKQVWIKQWIQTVLRLKSCAITEAWKGKHEQIVETFSYMNFLLQYFE